MADLSAKNSERESEHQGLHEGAEKPNVSLKKPESKEIKETSKEFVEGVSEVVETTEAAEFAEGNVSEKAGEDKKKVSGGSLKRGTAVTGGAVAAMVDAPPIEMMQSQIAAMVKKEIRVLEKEAKKMMSNPGSFSPFKLNGILTKIRQLKDILANLGYAAAETVKDWWLKFVKGITT